MKRQPSVPSLKLRVQLARLNEAEKLLAAAAQFRRCRPSVPTPVREAEELVEAADKVHKYHVQRVRHLRRQVHKMEHTEAAAESHKMAHKMATCRKRVKRL